jgi:hypothetical protein
MKDLVARWTKPYEFSRDWCIDKMIEDESVLTRQ